uniref:Uncharacterized protein n=1 Tax=Rhipicephalus microplus TaxID=6941 RepID=A0A6G5AG97_RHIMP
MKVQYFTEDPVFAKNVCLPLTHSSIGTPGCLGGCYARFVELNIRQIRSKLFSRFSCFCLVVQASCFTGRRGCHFGIHSTATYATALFCEGPQCHHNACRVNLQTVPMWRCVVGGYVSCSCTICIFLLFVWPCPGNLLAGKQVNHLALFWVSWLWRFENVFCSFICTWFLLFI